MKVAINGMGRIGRAALKLILETPQLEIVAVNDIVDIDTTAYLLQYDSVYGTYPNKILHEKDHLKVGEKAIPYFSERDPLELPWKELGVEVVIESTGIFTKQEDAQKHIFAGADTVVISAPTKSADTPTIVHGVNSGSKEAQVFSCASCTTNNISPVVEILGRRVGIKKSIMTTIHAYTATQSIVDGPSRKNKRMGRGAANNIIPTSTGAAIATTKALPEYKGKFDGVAVRVPVPVGSLSDMNFVLERSVTVEEINTIFAEEAATDRYKEVIAVTNDPIVSSDIIRSPYASTIDLSMTRVVDVDLLKIMTWYDNEWGFTNQMIREIIKLVP